MAREIKFRAWNKNLEEYVNSEKFVIDPTNGDVIDVGGYELLEVNNEAVLEQYTGIDDRVDNSVYENDIVEIEYTAGHHEKWDMDTLARIEDYDDVDTIVRGVVHIWPSTGVIINHISSENPEQFVGDYRIPQYLHINKDCAVIGNIHKNPELLEE
ncbi:YopX family protein [Leuconostoc mesenteroides]|uniref:YopX family protein n=1 Tax=Leuconostoc mesenteroides TaxID=1245 RepID=UPI00235EA85B|nr:YopX family protein [Leuconostoc mesenteroides]